MSVFSPGAEVVSRLTRLSEFEDFCLEGIAVAHTNRQTAGLPPWDRVTMLSGELLEVERFAAVLGGSVVLHIYSKGCHYHKGFAVTLIRVESTPGPKLSAGLHACLELQYFRRDGIAVAHTNRQTAGFPLGDSAAVSGDELIEVERFSAVFGCHIYTKGCHYHKAFAVTLIRVESAPGLNLSHIKVALHSGKLHTTVVASEFEFPTCFVSTITPFSGTRFHLLCVMIVGHILSLLIG
jgi:hypothetical protein